MSNHELLDALVDLPEPDRLAAIRTLSEDERREFRHHWKLWARNRQLAPPGDWTTWLVLAGRGFGKTRAGAEWIRTTAQADPAARIALVGASLGEVRAVMVEGESGILAVCPPGQIPSFEPSLRRLTWGNGAQATLYSAGEPGTRVLLREGCDRTLATCAGRYGNAINFQGEPHLPGNDLITRYPSPSA